MSTQIQSFNTGGIQGTIELLSTNPTHVRVVLEQEEKCIRWKWFLFPYRATRIRHKTIYGTRHDHKNIRWKHESGRPFEFEVEDSLLIPSVMLLQSMIEDLEFHHSDYEDDSVYEPITTELMDETAHDVVEEIVERPVFDEVVEAEEVERDIIQSVLEETAAEIAHERAAVAVAEEVVSSSSYDSSDDDTRRSYSSPAPTPSYEPSYSSDDSSSSFSSDDD